MKSRNSERGHALVLVLLLASLFGGLWVVVHRATRDASTAQISAAKRDTFEERIIRALAFAGQLLESDRPQTASYAFVYAGQDAGGPYYTTVTLARVGGTNFDAAAFPANAQEIASLPQNPLVF